MISSSIGRWKMFVVRKFGVLEVGFAVSRAREDVSVWLPLSVRHKQLRNRMSPLEDCVRVACSGLMDHEAFEGLGARKP